MKIYRARIDQPSTSQPLHYLHGKYCIVHDGGGKTVRLYFTEGDYHSMEAPRLCITEIKLSAVEN
jgi:hypothetical protein